MPCKICLSRKEVEEWNKAWPDEQVTGPDAFQILSYMGYLIGEHIYRCPNCGQIYLHTSWNELFPDGWTEFQKLKKLNEEETKKIFP